MAARIGDTHWVLVGRPAGSGLCGHCGRVLKYVYQVRHPEGQEMIVGRGCLKKLTGWNLTDALAKRMLEIAERNAKRTERWAAFTLECPDEAALIEADLAQYERAVPREWGAGPAHEIKANIGDGRYGEWRGDVLADYMRRRRDWSWLTWQPRAA